MSLLESNPDMDFLRLEERKCQDERIRIIQRKIRQNMNSLRTIGYAKNFTQADFDDKSRLVSYLTAQEIIEALNKEGFEVVAEA